MSIAGIAPTEATISDLSYPGSRKLFVYVKGEHMRAKLAMRAFIQAYAGMWGNSGELEQRGLVPLSGADAAAATEQATALKPLQASELK